MIKFQQHTKPSKYGSTVGKKISICLKKDGVWGYGSEQAPLKHFITKLYIFSLSMGICDVIGENLSHVTKGETAK